MAGQFEEEGSLMAVSILSINTTYALLAQASGEPWDVTRGFAIAIAGLSIVFTALLLISLFIASLPRVLEMVASVYPEFDDPHSRQSHPESQVPDDGAVLAAIGFVLHSEMQKQIAAGQTSGKQQ